MSEITKYDLLALDGGLNDGIPPTHILDNELQSVQNFYPWGRRLIRRPGTLKLTTSPYSYGMTGVFAFKTGYGEWLCVVGTKRDFAKYDPALKQMVHIDSVTGTLFTDDPSLWSFVQYRNVGYGARYNAGTVKRTDGFIVGDSGISGPTAAPTLTEVPAGALAAGDYYGVVTFANILSGAESDFSPESVKLTLAADKKIGWSDLPISVNSQVTARNLYRTFAGQRGEYFFVTQIQNNVDTTYTDNVEEVDLGEPVSLDNGLPPFSIQMLALFKERCFATDGRDLFMSRAGYAEQFAEDFFIPIFPDDGHVVRGLLGFGDILLLGKTNKVHFLAGTDESDFEIHTLSDTHGVAGGHTMKAFEGSAIWLGLDDFYRTDGTSVIGIGSPRVRSFLDAVSDSEKKNAQSWLVPALKWYVTTFPETGRELVYNYGDGSWTKFKRGSLNAPAYAADFYNADYGHAIYCVFDDGNLYEWNVGTNDYGEAIVAKMRGKDFGFDSHAMLKVMRNVHLLSTNVPGGSLTAKIYRDGQSSPIVNRPGISLDQPRQWKNLKVSNLRNAGSTVSLELEYDGEPAFEIKGIGFEIASLDRPSRAI